MNCVSARCRHRDRERSSRSRTRMSSCQQEPLFNELPPVSRSDVSHRSGYRSEQQWAGRYVRMALYQLRGDHRSRDRLESYARTNISTELRQTPPASWQGQNLGIFRVVRYRPTRLLTRRDLRRWQLSPSSIFTGIIRHAFVWELICGRVSHP